MTIISLESESFPACNDIIRITRFVLNQFSMCNSIIFILRIVFDVSESVIPLPHQCYALERAMATNEVRYMWGREEMLHNEARELLMEAYAKHPVTKDIAEAFSVSEDIVRRLVRQKAKTGSVALRVNQRGRKKLLSKEDLQNIQALIEAHNDITIEEIREALSLKASYSTVERAVNGLGYTVKKKSLHASERDRARCAGKTYRMERTVKWH